MEDTNFLFEEYSQLVKEEAVLDDAQATQKNA